MLLEILAVLIVTFFASLGMIEASQWLLRQSIKCNMKKCVFAGTFDPVTKGHEEIIKKCPKLS